MDSFVPEFADRVPQISAFEGMLTGQLERQIFLIKGEAEIGKSFLLSQLWYMAHQELVSRLDFRDGEVHTFLSVIQCAIEDLGRERFTATLSAIHRITEETRHDITLRFESIHEAENASRGVNIRAKDITIGGDVVGRDLYRNHIFLPPTENLFQRQALEQQISSVFFDDLRTVARDHRIILSYDSFENATPETQQWLTGVLLDEIARDRLPMVIVILVGRTVPEISTMLIPHSAITELGNFDPEVAMEYWVHRRGLGTEVFQTIYSETSGHPKKLAERANAAGGKPLQYKILVI